MCIRDSAYVEALGKHKYSFLGVYDGHGGTVFAELAAQKIHRSVETYLNSSTKPLEAVKKAFIDLDSEICRLGVKGGTTASVVLLRNDALLVAHVGDTRVVLQQENRVIQLTKDHRHNDPEEAQRYRSSRWYQEKSRLVSQGKIKGLSLIHI